MSKKLLFSLLITAFVSWVQWAGLSEVLAGTTTRVSVASNGTEGDWVSSYPSISSNGRYVAFDSLASNLVGGDTNSYEDVFVHDCQTGTTTRVSVASDGTQANKGSSHPCISSDGRYVAFQSTASNLESGDTNGRSDVFLHDRQTGITMRVSIASDGTQGTDNSYYPSISSDGAYVAFESSAPNLVVDDTNSKKDIFVHYWHYTTTTRVSVASDGTEANDFCYYPSISSDGRYVAFHSLASNLVVDDTNGRTDIFVHDCQTAITTRVSVASDATEGNHDSFNPSISSDGRYVAFCSNASNLVFGDTNGIIDVFVHDRYTATTTRVSVASDETQGNDVSSDPSISSDGRYVAFESFASNLVDGDTNGYRDIFVHSDVIGWQQAYSIMLDSSPDLELLRQYRDEVLSETTKGTLYKTLLYKSSEGALEVLINNSELMSEAKALIEANKDAVSEVLNGNEGMIYDTDEIIAFLDEYAKNSPPALKALAKMVKRDMLKKQREGKLFFGFRLE